MYHKTCCKSKETVSFQFDQSKTTAKVILRVLNANLLESLMFTIIPARDFFYHYVSYE